MSASKLVTVFGLLAKAEASYGAGGALADASDGQLLAEPTVARISWGDAGRRQFGVGTAGEPKLVTPSRRMVEVPLKVRGRGAGAAFSATVHALDSYLLRRFAGLAVATDTTLGVEKDTYTSQSSGFTSGLARLYARGQQYDLKGCYADYGFSWEAGGFWIDEFTLRGILTTDPTDVTLPAVTYNNTLGHPKADSVGFVIDAIASSNFKVRRVGFKLNRAMSERADANGALDSGHGGWSMGGYAPELEVVLEAIALATYNPFQRWRQGTVNDIQFTVGATQYNKRGFRAQYAQLLDVAEDDDGPTALWTLKFLCGASGFTANDGFSLIDS